MTDYSHVPGQLTPREMEALDHAQERVEEDGAHDVTGCPRFCRALCRFRQEIKAMQERGVEVPS